MFWGERGKTRSSSPKKKGQIIFSFLSFKKKILRDNSDMSFPTRTLGRCVQITPECCLWSEGVTPCSGVQCPQHIRKHKCTAPQLLSPRPHSTASWQAQARKLSIPIAFRPCSPIKEGLLVKGCPLFPKHGKKKKKGLCLDWSWQLSLSRVFKELWMSLTKEVCG